MAAKSVKHTGLVSFRHWSELIVCGGRFQNGLQRGWLQTNRFIIIQDTNTVIALPLVGIISMSRRLGPFILSVNELCMELTTETFAMLFRSTICYEFPRALWTCMGRSSGVHCTLHSTQSVVAYTVGLPWMANQRYLAVLSQISDTVK